VGDAIRIVVYRAAQRELIRTYSLSSKIPNVDFVLSDEKLRFRHDGARGPGLEQLFLTVNQGVDVVRSKLDIVAVGDRVSWTRINTIAAKDAPRVVDVVNARVTLSGRDPIGFRILSGFDVDAVCGTGCGAQKASDTFFEPIFITLKDVNAAIARRDAGWNFGIAFGRRLAEHRTECDAETLIKSRKCFANFPDD
jgi:hypothetical protein